MPISLAQSSGSGDPDVMVEMNMTPLIDVMLVLLIMLIITIPIQNHAARLGLPVGDPPPVVKLPAVIVIDIDANGKWLWNSEGVQGRGDLETKMLAIARLPEQPEIHIRADKRAAYNSFAAVLSAAQRIGLTKIAIVASAQ